jgi:fibronectin-binding autotransporter adhesin
MKTNFRSAKLAALLTILCSAFAAESVFGQFTPTPIFWIGIPGTLNGNNFGVSSNWSDGTTNFVFPGSGALCQFAGAVAGTVNVISVDGIDHGGGGGLGAIGGSFGASGVFIEITSNQTSPVNLFATNQAVGMGLAGIQVDAGAGQFTLGDNISGHQLTCTLRPSAGIHGFTNNSAYPEVINPTFQIQNGGGNQHEIDFGGTGDFAITNNLRENNNAPVNIIQFFNTGTSTWTAGGPNDLFNDGGLANVTINAGSTLIIKTNGLLSAITFGNTLTQNGTLLKFDAVSTAQDTMTRAILGSGNIQWNGGTWTLTSGASTYSGSNILTGGELIANGNENPGISGPLGVGGTISFQGGTLGFGPNDAADYSSRFDTSPNQAYSIDTAGQNVTFATALASTGGTLTKNGPGTLTLSANSTYTGLTTVSAGKLVFQVTKSGSANITVADSAALGVTDTGTQITPGTLTVGSGIFGAALEFNNINNTTTAPLAPVNLVSAGTTTINVNSGTFAVGQNYPLLSWTTGAPPAVTLGFLSGALGNLLTNGNSIELNITALADNWNGINGGDWTAANNWVSGGGPITYVDPVPVVFDDTAMGTLSVTVDALVQPKSVTFNNNTKAYTITSSFGNDIGGFATITKNGTNTVTLVGGANTYMGVTTVGSGTLSVSTLANGGSPSDIGEANNSASNFVLDGGILQYTGGTVSIDRLFTITTNGGTIDSSGFGPLTLNNTGSLSYIGFAVRTLKLAGTEPDNNILAAVLADNGTTTSLTKNGPGKWVLTGNNTYSGVTTIANGELQVGNGGATGTLGSGSVMNNGSLDFNRTGSLTITGAIGGGGSLTNDGTGTLILANNSTYGGGTTINAGTLQVGNGGGTGSLLPTGVISNNSLLVFNTTGTFFYTGTGAIIGTGNVKVTGSGLIKAIGGNSYTGWTLIDTNATFQPCSGNQGQLLSSVVTNYGTLKFLRQDQGVFGYSNNIVGSGRVVTDEDGNLSDVTLMGVNTYTGGTVIAGAGFVLGDNATPGAGSIVGNVIFTNSPTGQDLFRYLTFNRPDNVTFNGNITGTGGANAANAGQVIQNTAATLTLGGNNSYIGGTVVSNGTIVYTGTINSTGGGIVVGALTFSNSATCSLSGGFSGTGAIVMGGSGLTTLGASNNANFTGSMTASNGILVVSRSAGGAVNVSGGTLAAGGFKTVNTLTIGDSAVSPAVAGSLNISSGVLSMSLNKALVQSNSFVQMTVTNVLTTFTTNGDNSITTNKTVTSATGSITYTGGTLQLINVGPTLQVGDRFVLFSKPIPGGNSIPITASGFTATSSLGTDGSVVITSVALPPAPKINNISLASGTNLVISATNNFGPGGSWDLLSTNDLTVPLSNWPVIMSGTFDVNGNLNLTNPLGTNTQQFFNLRAP